MRAALFALVVCGCGFDALPPLDDAAPVDVAEMDTPDPDAGDPDASDPDARDPDAALPDATTIDAASPTLVLAEVPLRIAVSTSVNVRLTISGAPGVVTWSLAAAGGSFAPAVGQITLNASGLGTIATQFAAPGVAGDLMHTLSLDDGAVHQSALETKVRVLSAVGNSTSFTDSAGLQVPPNFLYGQRIVISQPRVIMRLGLWSDAAGAAGRLAVYTDNGTVPEQLVVATAPFVIVTGKTEVDVTTPTLLAPGGYWVLGDFDAGALVRRGSLGEAVASTPLPSTSPLPMTLTGVTTASTRSLNYFAQVAP